jgi:hypothetical protein
MADLHPLSPAVALALLAAGASAQVTVPFPLTAAGAGPQPGIRVFEPRPAEIALLAEFQQVRLTEVPQADGPPVELLLERIDLGRLGFGFQVDGQPRPDLLEGLDLSVWTGAIAGRPGSEAVLSFSNHGVRGWIADGASLTHLLPEPVEGDWSRAVALVASETQLREVGVENSFRCSAESLPRELVPVHAQGEELVAFGGSGCELREAKIAIETDFQLNQVFGGSLAAETAHITSLLAAGSDRYVEQIDTILTYPYVQFYTTSNDPWSSPDNGGDSIDMLNEFVGAWSGNLPAGAVLGHLLSGAGLGGGVAYLSGICDTTESFSFAVSGNLNGQTQFPITVNPFNWEFIVYTHETGHSFSSPHTHDYNPPIDNCAGGACINNGTIMSYCHLCDGGMLNMTTFFHPTVVNVMKNGAASCLPLFTGVEVQTLTLIAPDVATPVSATVVGTPVGAVNLNYRSSPFASFQAVAMSPSGGNQYSANLPGQPCGSAPEYFVSFDDASCGPVISGVVAVDVGLETILLADDFEAPSGWTVGAAGDNASSGVWERVNPVSTSAQPGDDVTVGGTLCFVTGQHPGGSVGANDVDNGKTTLTSPTIDLSGGDARVGYWRWFSNDAGSNPGQEIFEIAISNNGGSTWTPVENVGPGGQEASGGWFFHEFTVSDLVAPTANVRLRFVASDDIGAVVEAAIDEFVVRRVSCVLCQDDLGFGGPGDLRLDLCGDPLTAGGTADLAVTNAVPGTPVYLLASLVSNPTPFVNGTLITNPLVGSVQLNADGAGSVLVSGLQGGVPVPVTLFLQSFAIDLAEPGFIEISNALAAQFLP